MLMPILESNEKKRREAILKVASRDLELGFLYSVFNLEWTMRRMILCFSKCPSIVIRALLAQCSGFWRYCELWDKCVHDFDTKYETMAEILGVQPKGESRQNGITDYFDRRHVLVHGAKSGIGAATAICGIEKLLEASEKLVKFSRDHGYELFAKVKPRQNVRCGFTGNRKTPLFSGGQTQGACPGNFANICPLLADKATRGAIRKHLRKTLKPVQELADVKDEALIERVQAVAHTLGIEGACSVKKATRELQKSLQKRKARK